MASSTRDTSLVIKISHSEPIELTDFANTMAAFGALFSDYCKDNGDSQDAQRAKLCLEKVEHGSIEIRLVEIFTASMLPFLEGCNVILDFAAYIKLLYDYFKSGQGEKPDISETACKNLKRSLDVVANDNSGEMQIYAVDNKTNHHYHNCVVYQIEGNAAQNRLDKFAANIREERQIAEAKHNVLMSIYQLRDDNTQKSGNYGRIDDISPKQIPVRFADDNLKNQIINGEGNPFRQNYLVDVEIKTAEGRIAMYLVTALHDIIPMID